MLSIPFFHGVAGVPSRQSQRLLKGVKKDHLALGTDAPALPSAMSMPTPIHIEPQGQVSEGEDRDDLLGVTSVLFHVSGENCIKLFSATKDWEECDRRRCFILEEFCLRGLKAVAKAPCGCTNAAPCFALGPSGSLN